MNEIEVQWHPGFVAAMNLELAGNRADLIYEKEYNLNTKLLAIDLLVIKKERHIRIEHVNALTQKQERELADSVLEVSVRANRRVADELRGGDSVCNALLELMEPEINKIVGEATKAAIEEAVTKTKKEEAIKTATKMLKSGKFTLEEIHEFVPRLSLEEIGLLENV